MVDFRDPARIGPKAVSTGSAESRYLQAVRAGVAGGHRPMSIRLKAGLPFTGEQKGAGTEAPTQYQAELRFH
jgi:hypothetical protein